jgi:UDP-N-acetylmuramate: L-alanyl-gamma-D-glutamyl-meso-diaminopimelate ligase
VLARGCWTPREGFAQAGAGGAGWSARLTGGDHSRFEVLFDGKPQGTVQWSMLGAHNVDNALAAIAAARHAGVPVGAAIAALAEFKGVRRRMELTGTAAGISIYDDFAHHPTAITTTIEGLRRRVGAQRLVAVLEARSNTMRMGVHKDTLAPSLAGADAVYLFAPPDLGWDAGAVATAIGPKATTEATVDALLARLVADLKSGDQAASADCIAACSRRSRRADARQPRTVSAAHRAVPARPAAAAHLRTTLCRHGARLPARWRALRRRADPQRCRSG